MPRENEHEFVSKCLMGEPNAVAFCGSLFRVSQVIDDLVDQDKPVSKDAVKEAFWECLIEIPRNPFYQRHFNQLLPQIQVFFNDWLDSCDLEKKGDHEKNIAFVLRDSIGSIIAHCAYILGGYRWMREVSVMIREHIHEDTLEEYKEGLGGGV